MPDALMQLLGTDPQGRQWFFADNTFTRPGVYFWDGTTNVHVQDRLDELQAQLASAWQPIATAPKDGTRILVSANRFNEAKQGTFQEVAVWDSEEDCWARGTDGELEEIHPPTHWQPLPPPPQGKEQG